MIAFKGSLPNLSVKDFNQDAGALNSRRPAIFFSPTYSAGISRFWRNSSARAANVIFSTLTVNTPVSRVAAFRASSFASASVLVLAYRFKFRRSPVVGSISSKAPGPPSSLRHTSARLLNSNEVLIVTVVYTILRYHEVKRLMRQWLRP